MNQNHTLTKILTKMDLVKALIEEQGLTKKEAVGFVDGFFEEIRMALEDGHHLQLSGFGNFVLRDKKERPGRNPQTGEPVPITPRRVVTFKASVQLKKRVIQGMLDGH
jgi:integration host factor subunit alpha